MYDVSALFNGRLIKKNDVICYITWNRVVILMFKASFNVQDISGLHCEIMTRTWSGMKGCTWMSLPISSFLPVRSAFRSSSNCILTFLAEVVSRSASLRMAAILAFSSAPVKFAILTLRLFQIQTRKNDKIVHSFQRPRHTFFSPIFSCLQMFSQSQPEKVLFSATTTATAASSSASVRSNGVECVSEAKLSVPAYRLQSNKVARSKKYYFK